MKCEKLQIGSDERCGKTPLLKLKRLKRSRVTEMNRKIRVTIFLVFVLSLSCSLVSAAYVENPPVPDIKVDIESHPYVVEVMAFQHNNCMNFSDKDDVQVFVYEGCAKDVVILDRTPWVRMVHGDNLKLGIKKSSSDAIAKTNSATFSNGYKLSFETNILEKIFRLPVPKIGYEYSEALTVEDSETITRIRSEEVSEERDLSNHWGDADFCIVYTVDIYYYTVHTYSRENDEWTRELVGVAKDIRSELVSSPNNERRYVQNDKPLMSFNENLSDRYRVTWDNDKKTYVTKDKYRV